MRVDVDKIAAEVEARRLRRALEEQKPFYVDVVRESRLLSDLVCWPDLMDECDDLEVDDFSDNRNASLFRAMRVAQRTHGAFDLQHIFDAIERLDVHDDVKGELL